MTAQLAAPVAIAVPDLAAPVRGLAAKIELILEAAVIGAIGPAAGAIDGAMIAKPRRQCRRRLKIRLNEGRRGPRRRDGRRGARRCGGDSAEKSNRSKKTARYSKGFHVMLSEEIMIDGAS